MIHPIPQSAICQGGAQQRAIGLPVGGELTDGKDEGADDAAVKPVSGVVLGPVKLFEMMDDTIAHLSARREPEAVPRPGVDTGAEWGLAASRPGVALNEHTTRR